MNKHNVLYAIIGLLAGFIIGFIYANQVNREQSGGARPPAETRPNANTAQTNDNGARDARGGSSTPGSPSPDEIREAIAKADARAEDVALQRNFGMVLYRYANQTQNAEFLPSVARMLKRAYDADPQDRDLAVALGNVYFDMGQASDPARFADAREYYLKALELKADDVNVRTDLGLTYYYGQPSDPARAIAEYRKSLALDPRHEPTLQNLAAALIAARKTDEAQKIIEQLSGLNPQNPALPNLRAQMAQSRNRNPE
ncbi:MAG TPA: tetratricopeptide repeat protein [Pyrinomonadaceae bacterium]|nr:tetratricopeptide repeat protein [Pyrinomonadaceae bacterium]